LEDALLSPGELLDSTEDPFVNGCGTEFAGCVVHGTEAGSIDVVEPVFNRPSDQDHAPAPAALAPTAATVSYGFRCLWPAPE
jgi:hypothetical protein